MKKPSMNKDIKRFGVYRILSKMLVTASHIKNTDDYDHYTHNIHHYIKSSKYYKNQDWYKQRGIEQKLILLPVQMHLDLEKSAMSDAKFYQKYGIERTKLLFRKKYSEY